MRHRGMSGEEAARRVSGDEGAVLIELALIAPFLFLILFAIVEFGYGYGQSLDVRHGARETARLAAVNYQNTADPSPDVQRKQIVDTACARMQIVGGDGTNVSITFVGGASANDRGDFVAVEVRRPLKQITGFLDFALSGVVLRSHVETLLEQDATFSETPPAGLDCP